MKSYTLKPCSRIEGLNKYLVDHEINFSHTVLFSAEIDLTEMEIIRNSASNELKPTYTAFIAKAVAQALLEFPYANRRLFTIFGFPIFAFYQAFNDTDIAVAIERDVEGFSAVAYIEILRQAHLLSLAEVTEKLRQFSISDLSSSEQWRSFYNIGMKFPSWLAGRIANLPAFLPTAWKKYRGGSVLISSPAKYGVDGIVAAWTHPLSFSFGLAQKKPMVKNDEIVAVKAFSFVLNWDRRVMAGAQAAKFFARICELLRDPKLIR